MSSRRDHSTQVHHAKASLRSRGPSPVGVKPLSPGLLVGWKPREHGVGVVELELAVFDAALSGIGKSVAFPDGRPIQAVVRPRPPVALSLPERQWTLRRRVIRTGYRLQPLRSLAAADVEAWEPSSCDCGIASGSESDPLSGPLADAASWLPPRESLPTARDGP